MNRSYSKIRHIQEANSRLEKRILSEQKTGCIKGDCENGSGTYKLKDGAEYTGEFKDGNFNGQGTFKYTDGSVYVGQFENDKFNGPGVYKNSAGGVYRGQFKDDKRNGQGTYINSKGVKFSGVWVDGKLDGKLAADLEKGTESNQTNDECIEGNCKNGQGTKKYSDGTVYEGLWKDEKRNGEGTYTNINGVKSSGVWVDGKLDGKTPEDLDKLTQSNTGCTQPTEPTHRYKDDKNYRYAKSGDCWWAKNINNNKWFNLTELVKTRPDIQISIDRLNDGTNLIKL